MDAEKKRRAPPPPRPKITLQIPDANTPRTPNVYWAPNMFQGLPPGTPAHVVHGNPYFNPFVQMYHNNKAGDFMFKQFEGFKDFTMNTAKSGLSVGEKSAFWFISKLRVWSKRWFTHFFLSLCLVLYSVMGAAIFMALEGPHEEKYNKTLLEIRRDFTSKIHKITLDHRLNQTAILNQIAASVREYEPTYQEVMKHLATEDKTWSFWNSMVYAGTIYTTIGEQIGELTRTPFGQIEDISNNKLN